MVCGRHHILILFATTLIFSEGQSDSPLYDNENIFFEYKIMNAYKSKNNNDRNTAVTRLYIDQILYKEIATDSRADIVDDKKRALNETWYSEINNARSENKLLTEKLEMEANMDNMEPQAISLNMTNSTSFYDNITKLNDTNLNTTYCSNDFCISDEDYMNMIDEYMFPTSYEWGLIALHSMVNHFSIYYIKIQIFFKIYITLLILSYRNYGYHFLQIQCTMNKDY